MTIDDFRQMYSILQRKYGRSKLTKKQMAEMSDMFGNKKNLSIQELTIGIGKVLARKSVRRDWTGIAKEVGYSGKKGA